MYIKEGSKDGERTGGHDLQEWLRTLHLFNLEKWVLGGDLIAVYNFLMADSRKGGADLFSLMYGDGA